MTTQPIDGERLLRELTEQNQRLRLAIERVREVCNWGDFNYEGNRMRDHVLAALEDSRER